MDKNNNIRLYYKDDCIVFRSTKEEYGGLSNMSSGFPIEIGKYIVRNSEVLYQALRFPHYPLIQEEIIKIPSPIIAKRTSRKYVNKYTRSDWQAYRYIIMKFCIELKLVQNWNSFSTLLLKTEEYNIVELSKRDKVWGALDMGGYYEGVNALGRILMGVRQKIILHGINYSIEIPQIPDLVFLGYDLKNLNTRTGLINK